MTPKRPIPPTAAAVLPLALGLLGLAAPAAQAAPTLRIESPSSGTVTKQTRPIFQGRSSDPLDQVTVVVSAGATVAETASALPEALTGEWSAQPAFGLGDGSYTAVAEQTEAATEETGRSEGVGFTVDTHPPAVTLSALPSLSNDSTPSFAGTASEPGTVHVYVFKGTSAGGGPRAGQVTTETGGGSWQSGPVPKLADGTYTAIAEEKGELENAPGYSEQRTFTVDASPPALTVNAIATSTVTQPTFSGTTNEAEPVTLEVFHASGGRPIGKAIFAQVAPVSGKSWSAKAAAELGRGEYVLLARQQSALGNGEARAERAFKVAPPLVLRLDPVPAEIDTATPTFGGSSDEPETPVTVRVCAIVAPGTCSPTEVWEVQTPGSENWSAGPVDRALPDGEYEVLASQTSVTRETRTAQQLFVVDTHTPAVTIGSPRAGATLAGPTLAASGTAGTAAHDLPTVTLQLFAGGSVAPGQVPLQSVTVRAAGGSWSASMTGIAPGAYTLRASQADEAGAVGTREVAFSDGSGSAAAAQGPHAAFTWYPPDPHTGEPVTFVSSSTDGLAPITSYAWLAGAPFGLGAQTSTLTFNTPGRHVVQLRVTDAAGRTSIAGEQVPVSYPALTPFPVVRIVTTRTLGRVRLVTLSVRAPTGASVQIRCLGRACPLRQVSRLVRGKGASATVAFPALQRSLPPGVRLQIRVFEAGRIGKYTSFTIRPGQLPLRNDACLNGAQSPPVSCSG